MKQIAKLRKVYDMATMDLATSYRELFQARLADTDELKAEVFKLRYQVYCEELHWEDPTAFPDKQELDEYDSHSMHCLLYHKGSNSYIGTVRLVKSLTARPEAGIPLLDHCGNNLFEGELHPSRMPLGSYGEISRLAVKSQFRRRKGEANTPDGNSVEMFQWQPDEQRRFPHIALGLYLSASAVGLAEGMTGVYAMMEPRLARHLRMAGIYFEQVGKPIDFRGTRAPYYISRAALFKHIKRPLRRLLEAISEDLQVKI